MTHTHICGACEERFPCDGAEFDATVSSGWSCSLPTRAFCPDCAHQRDVWAEQDLCEECGGRLCEWCGGCYASATDYCEIGGHDCCALVASGAEVA